MNTESADGKFAELLAAAEPPLSACWQERALNALAAYPARRAWPGIRLVAVSLACLAALVAVGFVHFPAGSAKGALNRALAAVQHVTSYHIATRHLDFRGEEWYEEVWGSADGFLRVESGKQGRPELLELRNDRMELLYFPGQHAATITSDLPRGGTTGEIRWGTKAAVLRDFTRLASRHGLKVREWRERSFWRGARDIVEVKGQVQKGPMGSPGQVFYAGYDVIRCRAEIDPRSGFLSSMEEYMLEDDKWVQTSSTDLVEWNVAIPESVRTFDPAQGTVIVPRGEEIAHHRARHWWVTLLRIDVNRRGDIFLTLRRENVPRPCWKSRMEVEGVDDLGRRYREDRRIEGDQYSIVALKNSQGSTSESAPETITITVSPCPGSKIHGQPIAFRGLRLPPRQKGDDLLKESQKPIRF